MIRLWGRTSSINVRKALWALQETGSAFERIDAGGRFGGVGTVEFRAMNPNALVPVLQDGDVVLWESNVIVRYLCARYGAGSLYPPTVDERFAAEQWMDWQQTTLNPAGRGAFLQLIRTPETQRNDGLIRQSIETTEPLLDLLDAHFATRAFVAGEHFTMADVPVGCEVHRWTALPLPHTPRPNLARWYADVRARPAARGVLDIELE